MAGAEQMDGLRGVEAFLRRDDHANEVAEPVGFEERHDPTNRAHADAEGRDSLRTSLPQVVVQAALDRADEGHLAANRIGLLCASDRLLDICSSPRMIV